VQRIYLDHSATTPLRAEAAEAMRAMLAEGDFNPSSLHAEGRKARALLDDARQRVAASLGVDASEITFTSGGTESDNLAIAGVMQAAPRPAHVLSSAIEHSAVLGSLDRLEGSGIKTTRLAVDRDGLVDVSRFEAALRPETRLATIAYANNEIGTVQPIMELARIAQRRGVLFHSDAVAAAGWLPMEVAALRVDLLSLSAHKFGGPKGTGLLYVRRGVPFGPQLGGGAQEFGRRPGTEDLLGIVGLAVALELAVRDQEPEAARVTALRDRLEGAIVASITGARVIAGGALRVANILNVGFAGVDSAALLIALDLAGVAVSAGSACASGAPEPSHVLAALGIEAEWQRGAIRFSLGHATSAGEIDRAIELLPQIVAGLRQGRPAASGGWVD
jgi:cysteine desulfurase